MRDGLLLLVLTAAAPLLHAAVDLIIDTDMSVDVDDVGALCTAHALANTGEANILAITHDTANEYGVGAISAINHYYGRDNIPIGAYRGEVGDADQTPSYWEDWTNQGIGHYTKDIATSFDTTAVQKSKPAASTGLPVPDAVAVLRATLATANRKSVTIAAIGHATNLFALLNTRADGVSPLSGRDLVANKVKDLVWMGGSFRDSHRVEWNFGAYVRHKRMLNPMRAVACSCPTLLFLCLMSPP